MNINRIDFSRIAQHKVRQLLQRNNLFSVLDLSRLRSFCYQPNDGLHYYRHVKVFTFDCTIHELWESYKTVKPEETWRGRMVSFGLLYSRKHNSITYAGDPYTGLEPGQVIFLNLNLVGNFLHLAVGHEVTGVSDAEKTITICYLQNGASTGTQKIRLTEIETGKTEVVHETWYRSGSRFRDLVLYPGFHERGLTEFHKNVARAAQATH